MLTFTLTYCKQSLASVFSSVIWKPTASDFRSSHVYQITVSSQTPRFTFMDSGIWHQKISLIFEYLDLLQMHEVWYPFKNVKTKMLHGHGKQQQLKYTNLNTTTTWLLRLMRKKLSNPFCLIPTLFSFTGAKWSPTKTQSTNLNGGDNKRKRGSKGWLTAAMIWLHALQCTQGRKCSRVQQVPTGPTPPPNATACWNWKPTTARGHRLPESMQPCHTRGGTLSDRWRGMWSG